MPDGSAPPPASSVRRSTRRSSPLGEGAHVANVTMPQVYLAPGTLIGSSRSRAPSRVTDAIAVSRVCSRCMGQRSHEHRADRRSHPARVPAQLRARPERGICSSSHGPTGWRRPPGRRTAPRMRMISACRWCFYGAGVRPGRYLGAASPADIAPTLAFQWHHHGSVPTAARADRGAALGAGRPVPPKGPPRIAIAPCATSGP